MTLKEQQKRIAERLNETRKTIQKNIKELLEKWSIGKSVENQVQTLQANIEKAFKLTLLGLNVATRDQIDFLNKRIDILAEQILALEKSKEAAKEKKATKKKSKKKKDK
jgi:hypothetical protein